MPRDVSSSSSEDEEENSNEETPTQPKQRESAKFKCPADFVCFSHAPCSGTFTQHLKDNDNELWLIKAPSGFDPQCFSGVKVPLSGLQTVEVPSAGGGASPGGGASAPAASDRLVFNVLASSGATLPLRLLTGEKQPSGKMTLAPEFSGLLNVCENFGGAANMAPQLVPAAPPPSIPPGLKQRFRPFGCRAPNESERDGHAPRPLVSKRGAEEEEEEEGRRKKKKKKKKETHVKMEGEGAEDFVKVEPKDWEEVTAEEKKKKKKKKKDREREEAEEEEKGAELKEVKVEEVKVKPEPMDTEYGDQASAKKKKKKKKKSKTDAD